MTKNTRNNSAQAEKQSKNSEWRDFIVDRREQLLKLSREHYDCMLFAERILKISEEGSSAGLAEGIELVREYNTSELEAHLQHEEQKIFAPLIHEHKEHIDLCIALGKEHGFIRTLVEEMTLETAKKDLAEFALVLKKHTLTEEKDLFPLLESLFTEEQFDEVMNFTALHREEISTLQEPGKIKDKITHKEWLNTIEQYFLNAGQSDGNIVLFPSYRPDLSLILANHLDLEFFDYQQEVMQELGVAAETISLEQLGNTLRDRSEKKGIVCHNIEALLCVKTESKRRTWLQSFLEANWPNQVFLPISVYQAEVPEGHPRVCNLELARMPKPVFTSALKTEHRIKYDVQQML